MSDPSVRPMHTRWVATGKGSTIAELAHAARATRSERGADVAVFLERRFEGYDLDQTWSNLHLIGLGRDGTLNEWDLDRIIGIVRENCKRTLLPSEFHAYVKQ